MKSAGIVPIARSEEPRSSQQTVALAHSSKAALSPTPQSAFSLLEVMIALTIFFIAIFAILELTSRNLNLARSLQQSQVDISSLAAELSLTNRLEEGMESGDFGDLYPGYAWQREIFLAGTNGFFQVDFTIHWMAERRPQESHMSIFLYRPGSPVRSSARTR